MKLLNLFPRTARLVGHPSTAPKKKRANVAAFAQWSARINSGDCEGCKEEKGGGGTTPSRPTYRTRTTAETAWSGDSDTDCGDDRDDSDSHYSYGDDLPHVLAGTASLEADLSGHDDDISSVGCCFSVYDRHEEDDEEEASTGTDHSAYYSGSGAILVHCAAATHEDVSTLGGESRGAMTRPGTGEERRPPISELTFEMSATTGDDDDSRGVVRPTVSPLIDMGTRLQRSKDGLVRVLSDRASSSSQQQYELSGSRDDAISKRLEDSATILLAECDTLLRQLVTLELKQGSAMIVRLAKCREVALAECEETMMQMDRLRAVIMRRRLALEHSHVPARGSGGGDRLRPSLRPS